MRAGVIFFAALAALAAAAGLRGKRGGALAAAGAGEGAPAALIVGDPPLVYYAGLFKKKAVSSWGRTLTRHIFLEVRL